MLVKKRKEKIYTLFSKNLKISQIFVICNIVFKHQMLLNRTATIVPVKINK